MRLCVVSALAVLATATASLAGGPVVVVDDPAPERPVAARDVHDWSGFFVGLGYGSTSAERTLGPLGFPPLPASTIALTDGRAASLHAGYLLQRGNLVYGGELSWSSLSDTTLSPATDGEVDRAIDLKARLGFAANRVLIYGILGYSHVNFSAPADEGFSTAGPSYGLGVDFAATQRLSLGLEYLVRQTGGDLDSPARSVDLDVDTLSLRVGFNF